MIGRVTVRSFLRPEEVLSYQALCEASFHGATTRSGGRSRVKRWGVWGWDKQPMKKVEPVTDWLAVLRDRVDAQLTRAATDSISLNEFPPGGGVAPHVDSALFEPELAVVSFGPGKLRLYKVEPGKFKFGEDPGPFEELVVPSGSLYVMPEPVVHSFAVEKEARLSLVFRRVKAQT